MLMNGVLFFKEDMESADLLRSGLLASSVLEGIQNWRLGNPAKARAALRRGEEFLRVAAAFCNGGFRTTTEGITSAEAFSRVVAAITQSLDMRSMGQLLEDLAMRLRNAADGGRPDLTTVEELFTNISSELTKDRFNAGPGLEKWRL